MSELGCPIAGLTLNYIDEWIALLDDPRSAGKSLVAPPPLLDSYWGFRVVVVDVRIICLIEDNQLQILIIEISNRRDIALIRQSLPNRSRV